MRKLSKGSPPSKPLLEASKAPLESNKVSVTPALEPMDLAARSKLRDSPAWASNSIWSESPGGLRVPQKLTGSWRRRGVEAGWSARDLAWGCAGRDAGAPGGSGSEGWGRASSESVGLALSPLVLLWEVVHVELEFAALAIGTFDGDFVGAAGESRGGGDGDPGFVGGGGRGLQEGAFEGGVVQG